MHIVPESIRVKLTSGFRMLLREVVPEDRARALEAFDRLSVGSVHHRFWTDLSILDEKMVDRLVIADQINHVAWCALDPDNLDDPGYGACSLWRYSDDPTSAEISFTILDAFQGRGIGTVLMAVLWVLAKRLGIDLLRANVLVGNRRAVAWFMELGGRVVESGEVAEIDFVLDEEGEFGGEKRVEMLKWVEFFEEEFG